jgi:hypothetical protein
MFYSILTDSVAQDIYPNCPYQSLVKVEYILKS